MVHLNLDPILAQWGPFALGWQALGTALALFLVLAWGWRRAVRAGLAPAALECLLPALALGGVAGARLAHVLAHAPFYAADPGALLAFGDGGFSVLGALLGGLLAGLLAARHTGVAFGALLDSALPAALAGIAVGRAGCLPTGCAWGAPTGGAWGLAYWHPRDPLPPALLGVPLHPYALYEAGAVALILLGLAWARPWLGRRVGATGAAALLAYGGARLALSGFQGSPPPGAVALTLPLALAGLALGVAVLLRGRRLPRLRVPSRLARRSGGVPDAL